MFGGLALKRCAERRQVQVAVYTAELLAGLDHPGGAPAQRHLSIAPAGARTEIMARRLRPQVIVSRNAYDLLAEQR